MKFYVSWKEYYPFAELEDIDNNKFYAILYKERPSNRLKLTKKQYKDFKRVMNEFETWQLYILDRTED